MIRAAMSRLTHQTHQTDGMIRLALSGELDLSSAPHVEEMLGELEGAEPAATGARPA